MELVLERGGGVGGVLLGEGGGRQVEKKGGGIRRRRDRGRSYRGRGVGGPVVDVGREMGEDEVVGGRGSHLEIGDI